MNISNTPEQLSIYKALGRERKKLQSEGRVPEWMTTAGWQLFKEKYYTNQYPDIKSTFWRIANQASRYMPSNKPVWANTFFNLLWKGWLSPSTPVWANMGYYNDDGSIRGCSVSCSGGVVADSVYAFYEAQKEVALLSKNGFGTSGYLGEIRHRGCEVAGGGTASGVLPVFKDFVQVSRDISQGSSRRGAWAGYIEIDHGDFWELSDFIKNTPDDANIGWIISDEFIDRLNAGDDEAVSRYQRAMKLKMITGKGYFFKIDAVNRQNPQMYKDRGLVVKASNLCSEIALYSSSSESSSGDDDITFTCVLSSMNVAKYDEWKDSSAIYDATIFLDCVAEDFIQQGQNIRGLEASVRFTQKSRALGLGVMGFATHLQKQSIPFESLEAHMFNNTLFTQIRDESLKASQWMAEVMGEPEWCQGYGVRNTHRIAIAPTMSSSVLCGGVSASTEPAYKNAYQQSTAAGEIERINPVLIDIMKEQGVFNHEVVADIIENAGSVQHIEWLSDHEKEVFKTAFEIDQHVIIRLASARQRDGKIDQAQSINLFFSADEEEEVISSVHQEALSDDYIKSLYYIRSESGVKASNGECTVCE